MTLTEQAHYVMYRALCKKGMAHKQAYDVATDLVDDLRAVGLTVRRRNQ